MNPDTKIIYYRSYVTRSIRRRGKIVINLADFRKNYSFLPVQSEYCPVIGGGFSDPEIVTVDKFSSELVWHKKQNDYGLKKGQVLPVLPPNFLPTLFNDTSRANLVSRLYQREPSVVKIDNLDFVVRGYRQRDTNQFFPWDAGTCLRVSYENKQLQIFGPAVVSFDHAIFRATTDGLIGPKDTEDIVKSHLFHLTVDYFNGVVIHMPFLNDYSLTGSLISMLPGYRHTAFDVASKQYDLHMFPGDAGLLYTADTNDPNIFTRLSQEADFISLIEKLSTAWSENFSREVPKWSTKFRDVSKRLSQEIIRHIVKEKKMIKFEN